MQTSKNLRGRIRRKKREGSECVVYMEN